MRLAFLLVLCGAAHAAALAVDARKLLNMLFPKGVGMRLLRALFFCSVVCILSGATVNALDNTPQKKARMLLRQDGYLRPSEVKRVINVLPIRADVPGWKEGTYFHAELCMRVAERGYTALAKQAFERLVEKTGAPWKGRGRIGLIRLQAVLPDDLENAASALNRLNAELAKNKDEAVIDGAYHLGKMEERLGRPELAAKAYKYALSQLAFFRTYHAGKDFYTGLLSERQLRDALASVEPKKPKKPKPKKPEPMTTFLKAKKQQESKRFAEAKVLYEQVVKGWPERQLADEAGYRCAECDYRVGDTHSAAQTLNAFIAAKEGGPWRCNGWILLVNSVQDFAPNTWPSASRPCEPVQRDC